MLTDEEKQDRLIMLGMSEETIDTIIGIYGSKEDTYNDMLYYLTGYRNFDQLEEYED